MAKAYFDCVNYNGEINGRPISYAVDVEQINPQQVPSLATKLWEDDNVLAFVGSTGILDCAVNRKCYESQGIYVIVAGVPKDGFTAPNIAPVNMGPYHSTRRGAVPVASGGQVDRRRNGLAARSGPGQRGSGGARKQRGLKTASLLNPVPITDGAATALRYANAAGDGGGVVLDSRRPRP